MSQVVFPRQRYDGDHSCTLWHIAARSKGTLGTSCAPWYMPNRTEGKTVKGLPQLVFWPSQPKTAKKPLTNPQKPHLPRCTTALLDSVLHRCLFCSFIASPCWSSGPQVAAPFLPLRCAPFSSAWLDLAQLSSCGLGSIQWDWESPHEAIPCRCCHPTPIDLCFAAFLSAPHPLTALWRKGQRQRRDQTHRGTSQHSY